MHDRTGIALGFSQSPRRTGDLRREGRFRAGGAGGGWHPKFLRDRTPRLATADPPVAATKPPTLTGLQPLIVAG
jgi:hypothetical protein